MVTVHRIQVVEQLACTIACGYWSRYQVVCQYAAAVAVMMQHERTMVLVVGPFARSVRSPSKQLFGFVRPVTCMHMPHLVVLMLVDYPRSTPMQASCPLQGPKAITCMGSLSTV